MADADGQTFRRVAVSGIDEDHPAAPEAIAASDWSLWPLGEVALTRELKLVPNGSRALPFGPWTQSAAQTAVLPLTSSGDSGRGGVLVVGLNPFRLFDEEYKSFLGLLGAGQIAAVVANAAGL